MIYFIGASPDDVPVSKFRDLINWLDQQRDFQFDIETNVTDYWCDKKIITMQFGTDRARRGEKDKEWVVQWSALSLDEKIQLKYYLEDNLRTKIIHNAYFECVVCLFHGIRIRNVYDTLLAEIILTNGMLTNDEDEEDEGASASFYSLSGLCMRYLCYWLDKTEQMTFGNDVLTVSKIIYAARDVQPLGKIRRMQVPELKQQNLETVAALEMDNILALAMMTYNGMELDCEMWRENIKLAEPVIKEAKEDLEREVLADERLWKAAIDYDYYQYEDRITVNWNSPVQKKAIFDHFFPFLGGTSKPIIAKWVKKVDAKLEEMNREGKGEVHEDERVLIRIIKLVDSFGDYSGIERYILETDRAWLIREGFVIPGEQFSINWNSRDQVLNLFQIVYKRLQGLSKKDLEKFDHVIKEYLTEYKDATKLVTTYGEEFISGNHGVKGKKDKPGHLEPDGKIRTTFNPMVSTGRLSSRRPNMQNIPAKKKIGMRYRNAFTCPADWCYVDSDYASQELVIIAYMSQDPVWNDALRKGQDLHSVCAELLYGKRWKEAAELTCEYYFSHVDKNGKLWPVNSHQKCKCKKHEILREGVKSINFGLAYGMSKFKLAMQLRITVPEADALMKLYFKTFPSIAKTLDGFGRFAVNKGYIMTWYPFFRKRWFPFWKFAYRDIDAHLAGVRYSSTLGSIERAGKNMPIQGTAADITKCSLVMIYWYIYDDAKIDDKVKLVMQVHDQDTTIARRDFAEEWKPKLTQLMEEAALFVIPNGLLKSETNITDRWSK
jgi:DNA polymerase I-like protein with 3'-5' exonuclease and polymerase domains